jgi:hypothetical protein
MCDQRGLIYKVQGHHPAARSIGIDSFVTMIGDNISSPYKQLLTLIQKW